MMMMTVLVLFQFEVFIKKNGERAGKDPTSLDAFVHFTYLESGQNFVMCGLQGIHVDKEGYKLTTPCMHSIHKLFGLTDKGPSGMRAIFAKHKCNNICWTWPKPSDHSVDEEDHLLFSEHDTDDGLSSGDELDTDRVDSSVKFDVHTPFSNSENEDSGIITNGQ
ncbi:hypothetical protein V1264_001286 [Littorina saxatilis]|uniref:Alpha-type protein kinase domain-containing protein n=1 Tax=Littorina saxatilis TaxID=31220 RepID=A0AAN9BZ56_9CAEN